MNRSGTDDKAVVNLRIALLGYGAIAEMHAEALQNAGASIVAAAGPNLVEATEFAARHNIPKVFESWRDAIEDDVDAVLLASPSGVHAEQARAALAAGRHVLSEIPLALNAHEAQELTRLAADHGKTLMVCHTLRYWEPLLIVRRIVDEGTIRPRSIVARSLGRRRENVGWTGRRRSWTDNLLWHHGGHVVDTVLSLLGGAVTRVECACGPLWPPNGLSMDYAISLKTADGAIASISLSYNSTIPASDYLVIGEEDTLFFGGPTVSQGARVLYDGGSVADIQSRALQVQDAEFLSAITTGSEPLASAANILPSMRVLQTVQDLCDQLLEA